MRLPSLALFVVVVSVTSALAQTPQGVDGEGLYAERCAKCHEAGVPRAANRAALRQLSPDAIRGALTTGVMRSQGAELTQAQIEALARTVGNATAIAASATNNTCSVDASSSFAKPLEQPNWNGWGANVAQHRFQSAAMAQLPASQVSRLKLKWAFGFPGVNRAFAQPTVVGGRVFVGSASNTVYSLECQQWLPGTGRSDPTGPCGLRSRSVPAARKESGSRTSATRARRCTRSTR